MLPRYKNQAKQALNQQHADNTSHQKLSGERLTAPTSAQFAQLHCDLAKRSFTKIRSNGGADPLRKAVGARAKTVIDATAGWATDAVHLARCGYHVIALEKHRILAQLLQHVQAQCEDVALHQRLTILHRDSVVYLRHLATQPSNTWPDVIYLDPMYPPRSKTAAAKKPIAVLRTLVGASHTSLALFELAMVCARQRVVVKRAHHIAPLGAGKVGETHGKLIRFDIHQPRVT